MNRTLYNAAPAGRLSTAVVNKTLRNTYALLGMMFLFASSVALVAQAAHLRIGFWPFLIGIFGLSFAINATRNSA